MIAKKSRSHSERLRNYNNIKVETEPPKIEGDKK